MFDIASVIFGQNIKPPEPRAVWKNVREIIRFIVATTIIIGISIGWTLLKGE